MYLTEKLQNGDELKQSEFTEKFEIQDPKTGGRRVWNPGHSSPSYAVICFDEKDVIVAWLQLSFSDLTYTSAPPDNVLMLYPGIRWSPLRLAEIFPKLGIEIPEFKNVGMPKAGGK